MGLPSELDYRTHDGIEVRQVQKPWGKEVWWAVTGRYVGKVLVVRAGHQLSLQYHKEKLESMLFLQGTGKVILGETEVDAKPGLVVTITPGTVHRIKAESDLAVVEVSSPELDDVVRVEDSYGRAGMAEAGSAAPG